MAYVDLNPVRAALAETPEASDYTSIQRRIRQALTGQQAGQPPELMPFVGNPRQEMPKGLPFRPADLPPFSSAANRPEVLALYG